MKRKTLFLKFAVFLIGSPVLALCILGSIWFAKHVAEMNTEAKSLLLPFFIGCYVTSIPFFFALYQTFKLLSYIDMDKAFSDLSVNALKKIKYCAVTISIISAAAGLPLLYFIADATDAPGIIIFGLVITFASTVVAVFAAVLQKLLKNAIDIKSENDLTV